MTAFGSKATSIGCLATVLSGTAKPTLSRAQIKTFNKFRAPCGVGGQFLSVAGPWADTSTSAGRLMIAVLGGLADVERDLIRTRTGEGRASTEARGVKMGRKPKLTDHQKREAIKRRDNSEETLAEIGRS
jgi:hypothetical protein